MKVKRRLAGFALLAGALAATGTQAQSGPRVLVLVTSANHFASGRPTGMWLEEFATPYQALVNGGAKVTVVSPLGGEVPVDPHSSGKPEEQALLKTLEPVLKHAVKLTDQIHASDYDAIFIPGGHGPLYDLATDPQVAQLISEFARTQKPVASVCHGPAALVGVTLADGTPFVKGKKLTSFSDVEEKTAGLSDQVPFSVQQKLTALGGLYSQGANFAPYALVDGNLITGQNPASSQRVAELLLQILKKK